MIVIALDLETTGTDIDRDRIVEYHLLLEATDGETVLYGRVDPGVPIPAEATEVHGISDEDVADCETFDVHAEEIQWLFDSALEEDEHVVVVTYNGRSFDTLLLDAELRRVGQKGLDFDRLRDVDVYRLWTSLEPRSLDGAAQRFGVEPDSALERHSASGDVAITLDVLSVILAHFQIDMREADRISNPEDEVDRLGRLKRDDEGELVFAFGKYKGERCRDHVDYLRWMRNEGFPSHVMSFIENDCREKGWGRE